MIKKNIIVIGSYIEALVMNTPRLPLKGETLMGSGFHQTWGGKGSNQAVQAARLGGEVAFVSMVGKDNFGDKCLRLMENENVNTDFIYHHSKLPTASGFIICSADGQNIITIDIAALNGLGRKEIDQALERTNVDTVVLLQLEIPVATAIYACKVAAKKGATVILNPAPANDLRSYDLSCVDFFIPNETEARVCLGLKPNDPRSEVEIANLLLKLGCKNVVITLGEDGCLLVTPEKNFMFPAFKIKKIVDTTGAGDSFNAALSVGLAEGMSIEKAVRFGNAAAGLSVTKADTIPSFPSRKEVDDFWKIDY